MCCVLSCDDRVTLAVDAAVVFLSTPPESSHRKSSHSKKLWKLHPSGTETVEGKLVQAGWLAGCIAFVLLFCIVELHTPFGANS